MRKGKNSYKGFGPKTVWDTVEGFEINVLVLH